MEQQARDQLEARLRNAELALHSTREALHDALRRLQVVYEHGPDPIVEVDPDGRIIGLNQTAAATLGGPEGLVGRALGEWITGEVGRSYGPEAHEREIQLVDGRTMLLRAVPRSDGEPGAIVALRDVSERAATREEVERAGRAAAVARIAGGIAHEINNPLTVLQLRADLLLAEETLPEKQRGQLWVLRESVTRIARTVRTLQQVGRPKRPTSEWVGVTDLVSPAVEAARTAESRLEVESTPASVGVRGDPAALALAVEQLVGFASDAGRGIVRATVHGERVRIEVHVDHATFTEGLVLDPETPPQPAEGRFPGIGLSVAAGVARDHGGELRTGRDLDHGSWVRLELPLATSTAVTPPSRVLVVDDEPFVAHVLVDWGRRAGHEVEVVRTAELAMSLLERDPRFDVILCDDRLPASTGRDLLSWVRVACPSLADRFALMSGSPLDVAGVRFLPKPFTRRQLAELMDALLQER